MNAYTYCWNQPLTFVDLDGEEPVSVNDEAEKYDRHIIFVHGTVVLGAGGNKGKSDPHGQWGNYVQPLVVEHFGVPEVNTHNPNWVGNNNTAVRQAGGLVVAELLYDILDANPNAEILIIGYSHGGNVSKIGLNHAHHEMELDLSNVTLLGTAVPALYAYQLSVSTRESLNYHLNFYNNHDTTQRSLALIGSSGSRVRIDGHEIGRAQHFATNIEVQRYLPRGSSVRPVAPHEVMANSIDIWRHYMLAEISRAKGWDRECD